jgi:uncharacterized protein YndB with AHSA1/START domain
VEIDVERYIGGVAREISSRMHEGKSVHVLVVRRTYATTVEDLWDALTTRERIPRWFLPVSGDLRLGGRYQFEGNAGGEITACEPPRRVAATWEAGGGISWVTVQLTGGGDQATLELEHVAPVPDEMWEQFGPGAVGVGWELALVVGLAKHIETGAAVDPAAAQAWTLSDAGKAFVQAISEGWARASIAAGTDEAAAMAAAARTTAFYTGAPPPP